MQIKHIQNLYSGALGFFNLYLSGIQHIMKKRTCNSRSDSIASTFVFLSTTTKLTRFRLCRAIFCYVNGPRQPPAPTQMQNICTVLHPHQHKVLVPYSVISTITDSFHLSATGPDNSGKAGAGPLHFK